MKGEMVSNKKGINLISFTEGKKLQQMPSKGEFKN